jgi:hypothetical protein
MADPQGRRPATALPAVGDSAGVSPHLAAPNTASASGNAKAVAISATSMLISFAAGVVCCLLLFPMGMARILHSYGELLVQRPSQPAAAPSNAAPPPVEPAQLEPVPKRRYRTGAPDPAEQAMIRNIFQQNVELRQQLKAPLSAKGGKAAPQTKTASPPGRGSPCMELGSQAKP